MTLQELTKKFETLKEELDTSKKDIDELKKPKNINIKHNHSGGDYAKIKHSDLLINTEAGTTKTTPTTVDGWIKIVVNGQIYYIPIYTSKTT